MAHQFGVHCAAVGLALTTLLASGGDAQTTIDPSFTFPASQASPDTQMGLTFDGTYYWSVRGDHTDGMQESQYSADGVFIADYAPGLDFRSIFSAGPNRVFARTFNSNLIYKQTSDGVFGGVTLLQGSLNQQSSVALITGSSSPELIARSGATVTRWDVTGQLIGTVALIGFGSVPGEQFYPQNRGIAGHGNYWFTYSNGLLSVWSNAGVRLFNAILSEAGSSYNSNFSYSFANGMFFVGDGATWRGYVIVAPPH